MEHFTFEFYKWEQETPHKPFLLQPFGDSWETWTWAEVGDKARRLATALRSLGLPPKSHVGLVSKNCREWIVADIAIIMAGYVSVPFFPTLSGEQIAEVLELGDVAALFIGKLEVWDDMKLGVPEDLPTIAFPHYTGNSKVDAQYHWDDLIAKHEPLQETATLAKDDLWTIIFTSGTTGTPKGVMLDFQIFENAAIPTLATNPLHISTTGNNRFFSYLPLNHIAERLVVETGVLRFGGTIAFAESLDTFAKNLSEAKPTVFFGVPRIYTKFQQGVLAKMPQEKLNKLLKIPILKSIVKKKIKAGLGLSDAKAIVSGAAPLPEPLKQWWAKLDINIMNGYGMTENCAICTLLEANISKSGSVGKAQVQSEVKIHEGTNEILNRGPYLMKGYYNNPEKTAEVIQDGWLHTGDQGYIDSEGYLFITGRVKDSFKTSKGEYIVPGPIEWKLSANQDIEQICLVGLGYPQPMALVNLSEVGLKKSRAEIATSLDNTRQAVNDTLPGYQKVQKIITIKEPWTVENGSLTPTMKIKRNVLTNRYADNLTDWYNVEQTVIEA